VRLEQRKWDRIHGWTTANLKTDMKAAQLVLIFCAKSLSREQKILQQFKTLYPQTHTLGCSTAGEISGTQVFDDSIVTTAIRFEHTQVKDVQIQLIV